MRTEFVMGNEAIALGAIAAGVNLVSGYPGTPSTETLETIAGKNPGDIYVEWSINEKAALEVAAGAAYSGARTLVTMKQVGLNVASDPLMCLEYVGVKGGTVILVADDPGPISSQTEQDTRVFGKYAKIPVFDPSTVQEAYDMIQEAFVFSEKEGTPVIFRSTTRVCHGYAAIQVKDPEEYYKNSIEGFVKDSQKWVIFPRLSNRNHTLIEERNERLAEEFSRYSRNYLVSADKDRKEKNKGIASHGISFCYTMDHISDKEKFPEGIPVDILKISTPFPFPEKLAVEFLKEKDQVLCVEELDPVIERELIYLCGKYHLHTEILGKMTGHIPYAGENHPDLIAKVVDEFLTKETQKDHSEKEIEKENEKVKEKEEDRLPELPVRPPVLCAGCPHRASFYAVKRAMKGKKTIFCGDIGCYTLGNAKPLDMVDTCLCMGAGINMAQGFAHVDPEVTTFGFVGDSTFFAAGITGVINGIYNQANMVLVVLDNSTTAMTGHQPHPGTGQTMMGNVADKVNIEKILKAVGVETVETVDPLKLEEAIACVETVAAKPGVKAIIFKSPCIALEKSGKKVYIKEEKCIQCKKCIKELGCPGLVLRDGKVAIEESLCTGCQVCTYVCPVEAIAGGGADA